MGGIFTSINRPQEKVGEEISCNTGFLLPGAVFLLVGSPLYLFGTILVTMVFNVPRNEALAAVDPARAERARLWAGYVTGWTAWNHVRTAAALAAAASLTIALRH